MRKLHMGVVLTGGLGFFVCGPTARVMMTVLGEAALLGRGRKDLLGHPFSSYILSL